MPNWSRDQCWTVALAGGVVTPLTLLALLLAPPLTAPAEALADCATEPIGDADVHGGVSEPRADLVRVCADAGEVISVLLRLEQPPVPAVGEDGEPVFRASVGFGDPEFPEHVLRVDLAAGATITRYGPPPEGDAVEVTCRPPVRLDGRDLHVGPFSPGCLGEPGEALSFRVGVTYGFGKAPANDIAPNSYPAVYQIAVGATTPVERLAGETRVDTAVAVSRMQFPQPGSARRVYLSRADSYADAVAGGVLTDGPILLVGPCGGVPTVVAEEITRLDPGRVVALGGKHAVCDGVLDAAAAGRGVERLAGATRVGTAAAISAAAFPQGAATAYLARADVLVDAVAGGALTDGPILLVPSCGDVPTPVTDELTRLDPNRVVALGGDQAICHPLLTATAAGRDTERLAGESRIDTAVAISRAAFPDPLAAPAVYLARADEVIDAVVGGVLTGGPILLVPSCDEVPPAVDTEIARLVPERVVALGGRDALCAFTVDDAATRTAPALIVNDFSQQAGQPATGFRDG